MSEEKIDNINGPYSFSINQIIKNINSLAFNDTLEIYYKRFFGWSWPSYIIFQILRFLVVRILFKGLIIWFNSMYNKFKWARRITLFVYKIIDRLFLKNNVKKGKMNKKKQNGSNEGSIQPKTQ